MSQDGSKFFQNTLCKHFPCHKDVPVESFNCMFCFCPLYWMDDCCGTPLKSKSGLKSCISCSFPHHPESYDLILLRIKTELKRKKACEAKQS